MESPFTRRQVRFRKRLKSAARRLPFVKRGRLYSVVFAPPGDSGGVKSLYHLSNWLDRLGPSGIAPFDGDHLVSWFSHQCRLFQDDYRPDLVVYPEIFQPRLAGDFFHLCFALGRFKPVEPHADLVVTKSPDMADWVKSHQPRLPVKVIAPGISRQIFEYDGRPKQDIICYMTRPHKHPETAALLRARYGDKLMEITGKSEAQVAEILKNAKVFVWRGICWNGIHKESSPRPPKEALVAGCNVVGLAEDLHARHNLDFGIRCANEAELIETAGLALQLPVPSVAERAVVRDSECEARDWIELLKTLKLENRL